MKIYGFFNSNQEFGDAVGVAITEDGQVLATHVSSNESWSRNDLGMNGEPSPKHAAYDEACPEGWECEFVRIRDDRDKHAGLQAALAAYDKATANLL